MKLPSIYINTKGGFILTEILVALACAVFIIPWFGFLASSNGILFSSLKLRDGALKGGFERVSTKISNFYQKVLDVSVSETINNERVLLKSYSRTDDAAPIKNKTGLCSPDVVFSKPKHFDYMSLGGNNTSVADLFVRGKYLYVFKDNSNTLDNDIEVYEILEGGELEFVSGLDTGPGILKGDYMYGSEYIYALRAGTAYQLQVISIEDISSLEMITQYKVPLPYSTASPPFMRELNIQNNKLYLGTESWDGDEVMIFDVNDFPVINKIAGYEVGAIVNSILLTDDKVLVSAGGEKQLMIFDGTNLPEMNLLESRSFPGWQTQDGRSGALSVDMFAVGRTVGGFNNPNNPELYMYDLSGDGLNEQNKIDIGKSIYTLTTSSSTILALMSGISGSIRVFGTDSLDDITPVALKNVVIPGQPASLWCDDSTVYIGTKAPAGIFRIFYNEKN